MFKYTKEHLKWLRSKYPVMDRREICTAFNKYFNTDRPQTSILACLKNHGIKSGRSGQFVKGQRPWNNGVKGYMGANKTSFKKGNLPHNHRPLWSERICKDGYVEISIPERNPHTGFETRFKKKHVWVWEQENGKKPDGCAVIFKDGDNRNFELSNLELVTRAELLSLNLHGYKDHPNELKPTVMALAKMETKAGIRLKPSRGRKK